MKAFQAPRDLPRDAAMIVVVALAPAAGVGIARFAYALLLPDMRASLGWSYAAAGFMNTVNAAGYLAGALLAAAVIRRSGVFSAVVGGTAACVASLALSSLTEDFLLLSVARIIAGIGAAVAMIAGGVIAAQISQRHLSRASFLLSLYYIGPGVGILLSGIVTPFVLEVRGPGSWRVAWALLATLAGCLAVPLGFVRGERAAEAGSRAAAPFRLVPILPVLVGYLLFGAGYIGYMTFMIAWVRETGGGAIVQSAFWSVIGIGGIGAPWIWSRFIARMSGGRAIAILSAVTLVGAVLPLWWTSTTSLFLSAVIFGCAFFPVTTATTAFVRKNYASAAWPAGIAAMTVAFGIGQIVGPLLTGVITDFGGSLSLGLAASTGLIALTAIAAACQNDLGPRGAAPEITSH